MSTRELILGTRGSELALCQSGHVAQSVRDAAPRLSVELMVIKTEGDRVQGVPLSTLGGTGVFVKEIETALIEERIDFAVHSMKDLPASMPDALTVAAVPPREDARDALLCREAGGLDALRKGARVGTSSPRRRAQLLHLRGDLAIVDLRGNLPTRIRKLDDGDYDAIILASAGLVRLGLDGRITERFSLDRMLPAPSQGALAIQIRARDEDIRDILAVIEDPDARRATTAERAFLAGTGGGCHTPLGAYATVADGRLTMQGCVATLDGERVIRETVEGDASEAEALGRQLACAVMDRGGSDILANL